MLYYVYILLSEKRKNWSYVGSTNNIERRFKEHQLGKIKSTKGMRPLKLIFTRLYKTKEVALEKELYFKSGFGREEKNNIIKQSEIV